MSDKNYLPVKIQEVISEEGDVLVSYQEQGFFALKNDLKTSEEISSETAEKYREALKLFLSLNPYKARQVFGLQEDSPLDDLLSLSVKETIEKAEAYEEEIKPGQLWYGQLGQRVVVKEAGEKAVKYFYANIPEEKIACHSILTKEFKRDYRKAYDMSEGYEILLGELREREGKKENG